MNNLTINKVIALLPMKGNSERVPNKNLKLFCGKPLYHWVLNELLKSKFINQVIVNTDSNLIKEDITNNFPVKVVIHDRPDELVGDFVSMNDIIANDLTKTNADLYLQTHSTNPLLKVDSVDKAIEKMITESERKTYDSIFSVTKILTRLFDSKGDPINHNPQELIRTQDLPPVYEENSNFFIFTKASFNNSGNKRIGNNPLMFEIDKIEATDIDEPQDFIIAESIYKALN